MLGNMIMKRYDMWIYDSQRNVNMRIGKGNWDSALGIFSLLWNVFKWARSVDRYKDKVELSLTNKS